VIHHGLPGAHPGTTLTHKHMTSNPDALLLNLAEAQRNLKAWEAIVKDLKDQLTVLVDNGTITLENSKLIAHNTQFIQASRQTWTYPQSIQDLESALKQQQQISQLNGTATAKVSTYWTLKPSTT
jgi:hypothetical protein